MFDPVKANESQGMSDAELEDFIIFAIFVCGKPADRTRKLVSNFYKYKEKGEMPLAYVYRLRREHRLMDVLKEVRSGQYDRIGTVLSELSFSVACQAIDLRTCSPEELEKFKGIGFKTSRFFIMYSRQNVRYAVLDTHVLKWLRACGVDAPKTTPGSKKKYKELEEKFLQLCDQMNTKPDELDFGIWKTGFNLAREKKR
jgi:hypothetical protein